MCTADPLRGGAARARFVAPILMACAGGTAWLYTQGGLLAPALSFALPLAVIFLPRAPWRIAAALAYYLIGTASIPGAIHGYWGPGHDLYAYGGWIASSALLTLPWAFARRPWQVATATLASGVPPLGIIGWLSPCAAAGVLWPDTGLAGFLLLPAFIWTIARTFGPWAREKGLVTRFDGILACLALAAILNGWQAVRAATPVPSGWRGVNTTVPPEHGSFGAALADRLDVIAAGSMAPHRAKVLVFPEGVLDGWLWGTQQEFAAGVPPGQTWLIGTVTEGSDAVTLARHGHVNPFPVTRAAAILLGGNWRPWTHRTLHPAWWQRPIRLDGRRAWVAICAEQLFPWVWMEAAIEHTTVVLATSNFWWAPRGSAIPGIERASTRAYARLLGLPVITAINH
jgi:hypothetical protein